MSAPAFALHDARLLADADLCVKCGLCLPHCPTYRDSQHEGDSPRGRIMLVQGLVTGLIEASPRMESHLDGCLSCGRCEDVCPARVPYSHILDAGRARLAERRPARTRLTRLLGAMLVSGGGRAVLRVAWALYRVSGLQALMRRAGVLGRGRLARLESMVPASSVLARLPTSSPPSVRVASDLRESISVFRGCASDLFERDAIGAVERLLAAAGYAVQPAAGQGCCGALHQHAGLPVQASTCAQKNIAAFACSERVASLTTGCAATLKDYAHLAPQGGAAFAARVKEYSDWLLPRADRLQFAPLHKRAALHTPCTAASAMKSDAGLRALLARIPGLEVVELDRGFGCCGAAGSHFVTHPDESDRLLTPKLASIARVAPDFIISGNVGCSLHIAGGLTRQASSVPHPEQRSSSPVSAEQASAPPASMTSRVPPVLHPAQLLAQQLLVLPPHAPSPPRS
ncbi:hypothetical protein B1810_07755 [Panacagrimonas perspica]|nr:(Fe-S)-binding protein [Panacagrimonas perspica]THD03767.1 hypothetical protein B1810_07755 [Panacagrimonas perspica]